MGGKRSGRGQHIYLSIAGVILILLAACAPLNKQAREMPECCKGDAAESVKYVGCSDHLGSVGDHLSRGDFDGAMKETQELYDRSVKSPPADKALMVMGLISAHYANPKKDYKKAMGYFTRLVREFPESPFSEESKIWIGVLQAFEKAKQVDIQIEQKKKELGK